MNSHSIALAARRLVVVAFVGLAAFGYGCGNDSGSLGGSFTTSATAPAVDLVKLVAGASSGSQVIVQAVIYGPDVALDLYAVDFHLTIGDTSVLKFVSGTAVAGGALTASGGQTIVATATATTANPGDVVVSVHKTGGGLGNGIAGSAAVIVSLTFETLMPGTSTLEIATTPAPTATDSNAAAIGGITFDSASGSVTAIRSGGGPY
jgi:hypothetical protein